MINTTSAKRYWIFWGIYMAVMAALAILWVVFGARFSRQKGDDLFNCMCCAMAVTYIAFVFFYLFIDRINPLVLLIIPLGTACYTMIAGFFLLFLFNLDGTQEQVDGICPVVYGLLTIGLLRVMVKAKRKREKGIVET